jgi:hypothetical protein
MRRLGQSTLRVAGIWSSIFALVHVAVVAAGPTGYRLVGAGEEMARLAEQGSWRPALLTAALAFVFALAAAYAFSAARMLPRLPFLKLGLLATGAVYTIRGLFLAPQIGVLTRFPGQMNGRQLLFSLAALFVGLIYLIGTRLSWRHLAPRDDRPWVISEGVP